MPRTTRVVKIDVWTTEPPGSTDGNVQYLVGVPVSIVGSDGEHTGVTAGVKGQFSAEIPAADTSVRIVVPAYTPYCAEDQTFEITGGAGQAFGAGIRLTVCP